ncbi:hypothetical protein sscle_11g085540 [Sclerotinia sclerotiorum 1980 UF-70]|uniref:Uncharacterized protein n=1 Tax=Sclerotinia sclerotiorum (strain ATCC 18683 / 1980 / Ss-1) TaxID=665079 RepID=A0A1D9QFS0_SCLS1|nr:hypothetical protein sscle_11g085540 [Sclerotinia sclerotiorum 1980 UF-70]
MPDFADSRFLCLIVLPNHLRGAVRMLKHRLALLAHNPSAFVSGGVFPERNSWEQAPDTFIELGSYYERAPWWALDGQKLTDIPSYHQWVEMWTELCRLFKKFTVYVDFQVLWDILEDTDFPEELFSKKLFSQDVLNELAPFCMGLCPKSRKVHIFRKETRCVGCSKQPASCYSGLFFKFYKIIHLIGVSRAQTNSILLTPADSASLTTSNQTSMKESPRSPLIESIVLAPPFLASPASLPTKQTATFPCLEIAAEQMEGRGEKSEHNFSCDCGEMLLMEAGENPRLHNGVKVCRLCSRYCTLYEMGDFVGDFVGDERVPPEYARMDTWISSPPPGD